jgi:AmmeMemoRadiSam system protein B/AmmeMemoRadiSam system protein A
MLDAGTEGSVKPEACNLKPVLVMLLAVLLLPACAAPTTAPAAEVTETPLPRPTVPSAPTPLSGRVRPSAIAGSWYPDDPGELAALVDEMLAAAEPIDGGPMGLIVPHAGYAYSGPVAAVGFRQLEGAPVDVAVIVASDHQYPLSDPISVWAEGGFETPLGVVPVDVEIAQALVEADPRITFDPAAHEGEHPIEIELPFLQQVCPDCRIVPVLMGDADEATVGALADALLEVLPGRRAVVVASSDLSHYPTYDDALVVDGATLAAVESGDPARVRETGEALMTRGFPNLATCACGEGPILVTMRVAQGLGADTVTILRYANSGDSPYGDRNQVVGYGAVMFWRYEPPDLTWERREELLALARGALEAYLEDGSTAAHETDDAAMTRRSAAFVTLRQNDELRGCIGHTRADQPLYQAVQHMAVAAATEDPRFPPLTVDDLADVTVEISVLSPFRRVTDVEQIEVGTHGLTIFQGNRQGLLLPQVPVEQGWDRGEFLENICSKAQLPPDCWTGRPTLYAFTAVVFGEGEWNDQ